MTDPCELTVVEAASALEARRLSARELLDACLARIAADDGRRSHDGDPDSINAWVRVYEERAVAAAEQADSARDRHPLGDDDLPPLCGVPVALKDVFAVAGHPLTGSSRVLDVVPDRDSAVWSRLEACGMVLVGHAHTHELALGSSTDQVGNPWSLERSVGGSSGGCAAAVAARMVPAAAGTDTSGSLRIPSALCGTAAIKPTRGLVGLDGVEPSSWSRDHAGPMARTAADCGMLLAAMAAPTPGAASALLRRELGSTAPRPRGMGRPLEGLRFAVSPRASAASLDADAEAGFDIALETVERLGGRLLELQEPDGAFAVEDDLAVVRRADTWAYHERFADRRDLYRPSVREVVDDSMREQPSAARYVQAQSARHRLVGSWREWLAARGVDAILEPTVAVVAPARGTGYDRFFTEQEHALAGLTRYWNWTGMPVVSIPAAVGRRSGLPVGVSLVGDVGADWRLLRMAIELQVALGVPAPPVRAHEGVSA